VQCKGIKQTNISLEKSTKEDISQSHIMIKRSASKNSAEAKKLRKCKEVLLR
jgi:hypothetical protein